MERLFAELARLVQETELLNDLTKPFTPDQQEQFELWRNKTRNILAKIYGPRSEQLTMFDQIHFSPNFYVTGMGAKEHAY